MANKTSQMFFKQCSFIAAIILLLFIEQFILNNIAHCMEICDIQNHIEYSIGQNGWLTPV